MFLRTATNSRHGFTLIELAVVMGVIGVVTAGLWRLSAVSNLQNKDQATAQQQLALISAVKAYLADTTTTGGSSWLSSMAAGGAASTLTLPTSNTSVANCISNLSGLGFAYTSICNYLPAGFTGPNATSPTTNPYGQAYYIQVKPGTANANQGYSFMIMTSGGSTIPDADGGRIANLIGGDGGFIYSSTSICGSTAPTACGALGAWTVTSVKTTYGFGKGTVPAATAGTVASQTFVSSASSLNYNWLARVLMSGDSTTPPTYNTVITDEYMGVGTAYTSGGKTYVNGANLDFPGTSNSSLVPLGTSPLDTSSIVPAGDTLTPGAIHLGYGYIDGTGVVPSTQSPTNMAQINLYEDTTSNIYPLIQLTGTCTTHTTGCYAVMNITNGYILSDGLMLAGQVGSGNSSDIRFKKDIHPLKNALDDIMKIDPVTFTYKSNDRKSMGVIAQELEKIYPQLVIEDGKGMKYVTYDGLIGPLISSVQELKRQNDELRTQLTAQAVRIKNLESRNTP